MILCPRCGSDDTIVVDSRGEVGEHIRRRRACKPCGARMTTVEMLVAVRPDERFARTSEAAKAAAAAHVLRSAVVGELVEMRARLGALLELMREPAQPPRPDENAGVRALPEAVRPEAP